MNEQDNLTKKIEKNEKKDITLAYILIVVLLGCILFLLYLKFVAKDTTATPEEHVSNYITIENISSNLNSSSLATELANENATFTSTTADNSIIINYQKDGNSVDINIPLINNELEVSVTEENKDLIEKVYKEITKIICVYYTEDEDSCSTAINNLNQESNDAIRFVAGDNTDYVVYINIMKNIDINTSSSLTLEDISTSTNANITNISINSDSAAIKFNYTLSQPDTSVDEITLKVTLYNEQNEVLEEKTKDYVTSDIVNGKDDSIEFLLGNTLTIDNVKKYSIEITNKEE